jgi:single-strand DNA-binding protein
MINKVILIGNVGQDPDIRSTRSGTRVANLRMATNERRKDQDGNWTDHTEWHDVVVWGRQVDVVEQYVQKGRQLYIEGALRTRSWEGQDGQKKYRTEVHAREMKLLGGGGGGGGSARQYDNDYGSSGGGSFPDDADDVPF